MARFWDTSAIVPLLAEEEHSQGSRTLARGDSDFVVWQFTETEAVSALTKRRRAQPKFSKDELTEGLRRLDGLAARWTVVSALDKDKLAVIRRRARALLLKHPLRAGDALQLAAALTFFDPPLKRGFVVIDGDLAEAADAEGFRVFTPDAPKRGGRRRK